MSEQIYNLLFYAWVTMMLIWTMEMYIDITRGRRRITEQREGEPGAVWLVRFMLTANYRALYRVYSGLQWLFLPKERESE